jgi:hypothetical protein
MSGSAHCRRKRRRDWDNKPCNIDFMALLNEYLPHDLLKKEFDESSTKTMFARIPKEGDFPTMRYIPVKMVSREDLRKQYDEEIYEL